MQLAGSHASLLDHGPATPPLSEVLSHLQAVYAFARVLLGDDADRAAALTETVFLASRDGRWSTSGDRRLREELLTCCASVFAEAQTPSTQSRPTREQAGDAGSELIAVLFALPWRQRAAIALIDRLGLSYAEAAGVLGVDAIEFRELLHRGRDVLLRAHGASTTRRTLTDRRHLPE